MNTDAFTERTRNLYAGHTIVLSESPDGRWMHTVTPGDWLLGDPPGRPVATGFHDSRDMARRAAMWDVRMSNRGQL